MAIFAKYMIPIFCAVVLAVLICIAVGLGIRYLLQWRHTNKLFPLAERTISVSIIIRVMLFNVYAIITFTSSIFLIMDNQVMWNFPYITQAGVPLVAFLVFGTQTDMFNVWCFWKHTNTPGLSKSRGDESFELPRPSTSHSVFSDTTTLSFEDFLRYSPDLKAQKG